MSDSFRVSDDGDSSPLGCAGAVPGSSGTTTAKRETDIHARLHHFCVSSESCAFTKFAPICGVRFLDNVLSRLDRDPNPPRGMFICPRGALTVNHRHVWFGVTQLSHRVPKRIKRGMNNERL